MMPAAARTPWMVRPLQGQLAHGSPGSPSYFLLLDRAHQALDLRVQKLRGEPLLAEAWPRALAQLRERALETGEETGSLIAVPLQCGATVIGLLGMQHSDTNVFSRADLDLLSRLAEQVAAANAEQRVAERTAELERANRQKERLIAALRAQSAVLVREASEDPLTGVSNRRHFTQRLAAEFEVAQALGQPLTLAIADLDRFKIVNDHLGHTIGDEALRLSASLMRHSCRVSDLVARIGGEEFALILPGMTQAAAHEFCERLRHAIESHDWRQVHPHLRVTVSIGVAQWDGSGDETALLDAADAQLYQAKRQGRNRVA